MKTGMCAAGLALLLPGYSATLPAGAKTEAVAARVVTGNYSVQTPAPGWSKEEKPHGWAFYAPGYSSGGGYYAGFYIKPVDKITDGKSFLAYVKMVVENAPDDYNSKYKGSKKRQYRFKVTDQSKGDHHIVVSQVDYEMTFSAGSRFETTPHHEVMMRAWDEHDSEQVLILEFHYHGRNLDEKEFNDLANVYFKSLDKVK